jgi:hypothetical protein
MFHNWPQLCVAHTLDGATTDVQRNPRVHNGDKLLESGTEEMNWPARA